MQEDSVLQIKDLPGHRQRLIKRFSQIRSTTEQLAERLSDEDQVVQSMPDASPTKWHLAHTSWFFEIFILQQFESDYQPHCAEYTELFNSYYNQIGPQYSRQNRGLITRPGVSEVRDYRHGINKRIAALLDSCDENALEQIAPLLILGINHEQQHQELIITDIKHAFSFNPLFPVLTAVEEGVETDTEANRDTGTTIPLNWHVFESGIYQIGQQIGDSKDEPPSFCFDNEGPRHRVFQESFEIASRPVTNGEFSEFISAGGYQTSSHWLSEGWAWVQSESIQAPLYWTNRDGVWHQYSLAGFREVDANEAVTHLSYFEADAYASWAGKRLPTEVEWEIAALEERQSGSTSDDSSEGFMQLSRLHPGSVRQTMFGDVWNWTSSAYSAYPGYRASADAIGEYNGKFMCNQYVLRGGSCATPEGHVRVSYRNFFPTHTRWQFSGVRLAASLK